MLLGCGANYFLGNVTIGVLRFASPWVNTSATSCAHLALHLAGEQKWLDWAGADVSRATVDDGDLQPEVRVD